MQDQIDALKEVNKMLRKVDCWKNGKRTMVNVESNSTNYQNARVPARDYWGNPNPVVRDRAVKSD